MRLRVVGCSPAWPNPGSAQSGYLVEEGGRRLLLDCGPGVLARLRETEPWPQVDAIAITHLHLDHWADLVSWAWGVRLGPGGDLPVPELWLPTGAAAELAASKLAGGDAVVETFPVREYGAGPFVAAGFEVTALALAHYDAESFGLRVTGAGGTLAYGADTAPTLVLAELGRDADLFLCEATLAEPERGPRKGHMTAEAALAAFRSSGARRLLVVHRPIELPLPDGVERARDGLVVEL